MLLHGWLTSNTQNIEKVWISYCSRKEEAQIWEHARSDESEAKFWQRFKIETLMDNKTINLFCRSIKINGDTL